MSCHLTATLKTLRQSILAIGYGNELRGDDGVGQRVARAVEEWRVPNLRSLAIHQLTPELAEELVDIDRVIFVDADANAKKPEVRVCRLEAADSVATTGHTSDPQMLLAIAQALYNASPQAWLVSIPAVNFELGNDLSPITSQAMEEALDEIDRLIKYQLSTNSPTNV